MREISVDELIKRVEERNIDLGDNPKKIIKIYTNLGLIPKPKRKRVKRGPTKTKLFYQENTVDILANIKAQKSEGLTLDEIRDNFALEYVKGALQDLLDKADGKKIRQLAEIIGSKEQELESIVEAPLIYLIEGMSYKEAMKLLTLFCGVGFYSLLEAQNKLEEYKYDDARSALFKSIFYYSIAVLRLARTTGDKKLESTASEIYEKFVNEPIGKASNKVRLEFIKSVEFYLKEKGVSL